MEKESRKKATSRVLYNAFNMKPSNVDRRGNGKLSSDAAELLLDVACIKSYFHISHDLYDSQSGKPLLSELSCTI
jgi:hypothetical protein